MSASAFYDGWVRHRRFGSVAHAFRYDLFFFYLDLAELPALLGPGGVLRAVHRLGLARFRRADHLGGADEPLDGAVRDLVASRTGRRPGGPIRLLTHLASFGYRFNPVSFYYCYDAVGARPVAVVAEITNIPWGEQYCYVLAEPEAGAGATDRVHRLEKRFFISPFLPMDLDYRWRLGTPGERLVVHMESRRRAARLFDASLVLRRAELTRTALVRRLVARPFVTGRVVFAIYWQALRLRRKKAPEYAHPSEAAAPEELR